VFGRIAKISTDGMPMILFYLSGIIVWNYFSESFNLTSQTFIKNQNIFGKVYFPRLIMPLSNVVSGLIKFFIQFGFFLVVYFYFIFSGNPAIKPNLYILLTPYLILLMAMLGLGFGIIFTSLTTKYRDLTFLIAFGVQLLMYASPVIYPVSSVPEQYRPLILANPITPVLECFKYGFLGSGSVTWGQLGYSTLFALVTLFIGIVIFNKTERTFMDTV
jgi:lipopolysaccharide transport system permease protein